METTLEKKIRELDEVAKKGTLKPPRPLRPGQSSLHDIIRTPEQAERFMRLMKFASENPPNSCTGS
ncbi:MAG TPA: hypothetical protein VL978_01370 [Puia sp.]|nr:hypothetical protein [Puia sp.]